MKRIFTIIVLLITICINIHSIPKVYNNTNLNISFDKILSVISTDLRLDTANIIIYVASSQFNHEIVYLIDGTINMLDKGFVINIDPELFKEEQIKVFIHECVHISQIVNKKLVIRHSFVWYDGKVINSKSSYEDRPYEVEAMERTELLYNKYKKAFKFVFNTI